MQLPLEDYRTFNLPGTILILTGPPGAGKSTTAKALVESSVSPAVHLHTDDFWHFIRKGAIPPYLPEAHRQNEVVMAAIARVANEYAKGDFFVVVDGIIGPWFLEPFKQLGRPIQYIVLRPELAEAIKRCQARGGDTLTDPGPISALHQQFSALGALERHVIDVTSYNSPSETFEAVYTALISGQFLLTDG